MTGSTRDFDDFDDAVTLFSAAVMNQFPRGIIGYGELQANVGPTSTVTNAFVVNTVPVKTGRLISVRANGTMRASGPAGLQVLLIEDSTDLVRRDFSVYASGKDASFSVEALSHSPSAGNHNYTLAIGIAGSGPNTTLQADADTTCWIIVEDMGPDF